MRSLFSIIVAGLAIVAAGASAATVTVGPDGTFKTPCAAIGAARAGDVIEIDATAVYRGDVCAWATNNLTLRGVGGRAKLDADGRYSQGKAIWVISGNDTVVENIEFTGARVPDTNGAGIRLEGKNLTVRNCHFHHNENGILGGHSGTVLIEHSEFGFNGHGSGQSHNLYILRAEKLIFRFNYSHDSIAGHLLKSRAYENHILYNRLSSEQGNGSYEIDLPNGGRSFIIGNLVQQGAPNTNGSMIAYQLEGLPDANTKSELWAVNNTLVNGRGGTVNFFLLPAGFAGMARFVNNLMVGPGNTGFPATASAEANLRPEQPAFVDPASLDYRILPSSPAVNAGVDPGVAGEVRLTPAFAYVHNACGAVREQSGRIDVGAYEATELLPMSGQPDRCGEIPAESELGVVNAATFIPGPLCAGAIVSIFGEQLAGFEYEPDSPPLPTKVGVVSVELNGQPLPMFYISSTQINVHFPAQLETGPHTLVVKQDKADGPSATVDIQAAAPQIFVFPGTDRAIAQNQDWSLNGPDQPAKVGEYVVVYVSGIGRLMDPLPSGVRTPDNPLFYPALPYSATVNGVAADTAFLGLTPGLVGLSQANVAMPDLPAGAHPLVLKLGETLSNAAVVSIGN